MLTNGCGGLNPDWRPGTVVLIADHINLTGASPLLGATFIDLSEAYAARLRELARTVDPELPEGVYVQFGGPQFETPAEVRMAGILGGRPGRHVHRPGDHRGARGRTGGARASHWSPIWPPASRQNR